MAPEDACAADMLVLIRWQGRIMAVPLSQLAAVHPAGGGVRIATVQRLVRDLDATRPAVGDRLIGQIRSGDGPSAARRPSASPPALGIK